MDILLMNSFYKGMKLNILGYRFLFFIQYNQFGVMNIL